MAPFTDEQVETLNAFQSGGAFHPFTCGGKHNGHRVLVATTDGWVCPDQTCDYTQNWASPFMADPANRERFKALWFLNKETK